MKKLWMLLIVWIIGFSFCFGQDTFVIEGQVLEMGEKFKLIGATIYFENVDDGTLTDIDGKFKLSSNRPLPWTLTISYIGYHDKKVKIKDLQVFHKIYLEEDFSAINKVIIGPIPKCQTTDNRPNTIKGRIIDQKSKAPLAGVQIYSKGLKFETISDKNGNFTLSLPGVSPDHLLFSRSEYYLQKIRLADLKTGLDIELSLKKEYLCHNPTRVFPKRSNISKVNMDAKKSY